MCEYLFTIYKKFPENPVGKLNGTRLSGSFWWKIFGSNGTSEKVVLFPENMFHFFKVIFDTSFTPRGRFSENETDLYKRITRFRYEINQS